MSLPRVKLTLLPDLREYVNAGEYMRQPIRSDAAEQHDHRLREGLAAHEPGRGDAPDGDAR